MGKVGSSFRRVRVLEQIGGAVGAGGMNNVRRAHFSVLEVAEDHGLSRTMEFEVHIPIPRPSREQKEAVAGSLQQHLLQGDHPAATPVVVAHPVKTRAPERRESTPLSNVELVPGTRVVHCEVCLEDEDLGDWLIQKAVCRPRVTQLSGLGASARLILTSGSLG